MNSAHQTAEAYGSPTTNAGQRTAPASRLTAKHICLPCLVAVVLLALLFALLAPAAWAQASALRVHTLRLCPRPVPAALLATEQQMSLPRLRPSDARQAPRRPAKLRRFQICGEL